MNTEVLEQVHRLFEEKIRPAIQMDGGDIELVDIEEGIVKVRLWGACTHCSSSQVTLHQGVERMLKESIPGIVGVEQVV